ncbi:dipeptidase [Halomarina ordinaria]|uniref:Dipeptidase n=1 Tax=Halomarina ordinaria TaxID=3033939 RepID=A0ABD5UA91_9EURY|nr:dipeptidase [Halomarina sp. PSRA2]
MSTVPVLDGHNDLLFRLWSDDADPVAAVAGGREGHLDLPRMEAGGFRAGLFAVYVPDARRLDPPSGTGGGYSIPLSDPLDPGRARRITDEQLALLHRLVEGCEGLRLVRTAADLDACLAGEAVGAVAHVEGAGGIAPDLSNLDALVGAGVRSVGPVWSRPNHFAHGVPFEFPASPDVGPGLTDAGRALVRACEERGVLVDCAHLNAAGFWDVADCTEAPLVVSHAGVHALCPASRNLTDEQLDAVAESGGLVGITFGVGALDPEGRFGHDVPLDTLADHVLYVAERVGVEHVALGSDFDGASVPSEVGDVSGLPRLLDHLRERGLSERDVERVAAGNWRRVLDEVWREGEGGRTRRVE